MTRKSITDMIVQVTAMHAVYRMYNKQDALLYVGMTGHARRFDDHAVKRWFPSVAKIALEWHDTEASARTAELDAIRSEYPLYNISGTSKPRASTKGTSVITCDADAANILDEALAVMGTARGTQWAPLAERLASRFPQRWEGANAEAVSARYRALGIRSVDVRAGGSVRKGCHRAAIQQAAACRAVTAA